jgi:hypothetical protein
VPGSSDHRLLEETTELAGARLAIGFRRLAREHFKREPALLILRELVHHLDIESIEVQPHEA